MQEDKNRFNRMSEVYDKLGKYLVPRYDFLQDEVLNLLNFNQRDPITIVDLGAGSGIFLEKLLKYYPKARCFWIDFSEDFLKVARERLDPFKNRIEFILSPLEENWEKKVNEGIQLIISMSAIHHLESLQKKQLYKRIYDVLEESGWFFNIDEMMTVNFDAHVNNLKRWYEYGNEMRKKIPKDLQTDYEILLQHFKKWKVRNIDNIDKPKSKGDDIHESFLGQLKWLEEIGFKNVDLFVKYHLWCMIGGQK